MAGIKCNAPASSPLLRSPGSISSVHQIFVTRLGTLHFLCLSDAIALSQRNRFGRRLLQSCSRVAGAVFIPRGFHGAPDAQRRAGDVELGWDVAEDVGRRDEGRNIPPQRHQGTKESFQNLVSWYLCGQNNRSRQSSWKPGSPITAKCPVPRTRRAPSWPPACRTGARRWPR